MKQARVGKAQEVLDGCRRGMLTNILHKGSQDGTCQIPLEAIPIGVVPPLVILPVSHSMAFLLVLPRLPDDPSSYWAQEG